MNNRSLQRVLTTEPRKGIYNVQGLIRVNGIYMEVNADHEEKIIIHLYPAEINNDVPAIYSLPYCYYWEPRYDKNESIIKLYYIPDKEYEFFIDGIFEAS